MFLEAGELLARANLAAGRSGYAGSIPLPSGVERVTIVVFYYRRAITPKARVVFPPRYLVHLDPTTGAVLSERALQRGQLGPDVPLEAPLPRHEDERRVGDVDAFWRHYERLLSAFHEVHWLFASGGVRLSKQEAARLVTCAELFEEVAEKRVLPWYEAASGPFLAWMRRHRARSG